MENKEYLSIAPCDASLLPAEAPSQLIMPEMFTTVSQQLADRPLVVFLDRFENCQSNAAALGKTARRLFANKNGFYRQTSLLVGAPGLSRFYLPAEFSDMEGIAAKAAASAEIAGDLGNKPIMMVLSYAPRPASSSAWHEDTGKTYLICSEKVSSVLALAHAEKAGSNINITPEAELFSPIRGMPVSFKNILHTKPYEHDDDFDEETEHDPVKSAMVVFYELNSKKDLSYCEAGAEPLRQRVKQLTGSYPKSWSLE